MKKAIPWKELIKIPIGEKDLEVGKMMMMGTVTCRFGFIKYIALQKN